MATAAERAVEVESQFLAGVQSKLQEVGERVLPGKWFEREEHDHRDDVRATMADRKIYDRERFNHSMPHNRGFSLKGFVPRWFFGRKLRSQATATVLAPPGPLLEADADAPPVTASELAARVRQVAADSKAPHVVAVCSPSGFEDEAWRYRPDVPNVALILVAPREVGGWRVETTARNLDPRLLKVFDPEDVHAKLDRIRGELEARSSDLLTGGVSAESVARKLGVPAVMVQTGFDMIARDDPELRVTRQEGEVLMYRGATSSKKESRSMSLSDWIRNLFAREGDEAQKVNVLAERRAALSTRLDRIYEDIAKLERKESDLMEEGKKTTSAVTKRRIAGQIARLRKDIARTNTSASMMSKQINVISTHIHNLELAKTGEAAQLPTGEELTEAAVNAEEILERLGASDDLVSSLDVTMAESAMSADEADILRELEAPKAEAEPSKPAAPERQDAAEPPEREPKQRDRAQAE